MTAEFRMGIGDVTVAISAAGTQMPDGLLDRYRDYRTEREPNLRVEFFPADRDEACTRLGIAPGSLLQFEAGAIDGLRFPHGQPRRQFERWLRQIAARRDAGGRAAGEVRPRIVPLENRTLVERADFAGMVDIEGRQGCCVYSGGTEFFAMESFLRVCFSILATHHDNLLLHAAGIARRRQAYVFAGPSGTGKSTIAGLSAREGRILSDEMICVRCGPRAPLAFGTPFHGTNAAPSSGPEAPLRVVLFPVKDTAIAVAPLHPAEALRRLLAATFSFEASTDGYQRLLNLAAGLVQSIPMLELRFRKDAAFWEVLDAVAAP